MRLGLVSVKHNTLFDFLDLREGVRFTVAAAKQLQKEQTAHLLELMEKALRAGCDVLVTPECGNYCGSPGWTDVPYEELYPPAEQEELLAKGQALAKKYGSYIFIGMLMNRGGYLTNSCPVISPAGEILHIYDKIQLVGEEKQTFRAGEKELVVDTPFGKIGVCICWDMQFPEICRMLALAGARLVLCPTWGWEEIYGHARAYENGIFVASAMAVPAWGDIEGLRTPSEIVSPEGEVIVRADRVKPGYVIGEIDLAATEPEYQLRMNDRRPEVYEKLVMPKQAKEERGENG